MDFLDQPVLNIHQDLITRCRAGEREAYRHIYTLYAKAMYNVCFRITGNEDDADDVLQESFISAFSNLESYRGDATFGAWLKRIVVNKSLNVLKRKKLDPLPDTEQWDVAEQVQGETEGDSELTVERVKKAIHQLPDGYRSVLSLYLLEGYDHQEIASIMGITESTSKSQFNRAKNKLRELMTGRKSNEV